MQSNIFIPRAQVETTTAVPAEPLTKERDAFGFMLLRITQWMVVGFGALLPLVFTPGIHATLHFDKVILAVFVASGVTILLSLLMLRRRHAISVLPLSLFLLGGVAATGIVAALFSGDVQDALWGNALEVHTAGFMLLFTAVAAMPLVLQKSARMVGRFLTAFTFVSTVVLLYSLVRIVLGGAALSFNSFYTATNTVVGSFNDLAIFASIVLIGAIIGSLVVPLRNALMIGGVAVLSVLSMVVLAIVNFSLVWFVLGLFALLTFLYLITSPTSHSDTAATHRRLPIALSGALCLLSIVFIVFGQPISDRINEMTGTSYVEVRPSPAATLEIARQVYVDNAWLGIGPNRFADAWRQYKDTSLNQTVFWDTDFSGGYGYVPTWFITTGVVGGVLMLLFHLLFLAGGIRTLMNRAAGDTFWYFTALFSFVTALYLIVMSYLYVPSAALLLLNAFFIGLTLASYAALKPVSVRAIPLVRTRQLGVLFMGVSIVVILITLFTAYKTLAAYSSLWQYGKIGTTTTQTSTSKFVLAAQLQTEIRTLELLLLSSPSETIQQQFVSSATNAIMLADGLIARDPSDPLYHFARAKVYAYLTIIGLDGALANAEQSFETTFTLDPKNPKYALTQAQMYYEIGDVVRARTLVEKALTLKRNFADALFLITQIDVAEGNTDVAITTAQSLVTLEPNNPTRYYQLGTLYSATEKPAQALAAFEQALVLNPGFANARYFKALAHVALGDDETALVELERVRQTNPDNQELLSVIAAVESGEGSAIPLRPLRTPAAVSTTDTAESTLISPVNQTQSDAPTVTTPESIDTPVPSEDTTVE